MFFGHLNLSNVQDDTLPGGFSIAASVKSDIRRKSYPVRPVALCHAISRVDSVAERHVLTTLILSLKIANACLEQSSLLSLTVC